MYYKNGQLIQEVRSNILTYYFKTGITKAFGPFIDGKMEGEWKFYRVDGQLWQIGNFKGNNKHGKWIRYNRDGVIEYDKMFDNNRLI
jgi:antitoxin component YwqK of YwqJK toxin-antitoxin module